MTVKRPFAVSDQPEDRDVRFLEEQIYRYNVAATEIEDGRLLSIALHDGDELTAGLFGTTWGGVLEVKLLWVREDLRGRGCGSALLAAAEEEAVRRGCTQAMLDTHSFQAPGLYQRLGYEVYGVMPNYPRGHSKYNLRKRLTPDSV